MADQVQRWFLWDRGETPSFSDFLQGMRDAGWWYLGSAAPHLTTRGVECQFIWDETRGEPPTS